MYRLKPAFNATKWLSSISISERDGLIAQGWVYEGISGYVHTQPAEGRTRLFRFTNGREWRLAPESERQALLNAGFTEDGPLGWVFDKP